MRPVLIDTNVCTAIMLGSCYEIREIFKFFDTLAMSPIVIAELLSGFEYGNKTKKTAKNYKVFLSLPFE